MKPTVETAAAGFGNLLEMLREKQSAWMSAFATRTPMEVSDICSTLRACFISQAVMSQKSLCEAILRPSNEGRQDFGSPDALITWKESLITNAINLMKMTHLYECNDSLGHSTTVLTTESSAIVLMCWYERLVYEVTIFSFDVENLNELSNMVKGVTGVTGE